MADPQKELDFKALARTLAKQYDLSSDQIEELAVELLRRKQQILIEKRGSVATGQYGTGITLCSKCGRPL